MFNDFFSITRGALTNTISFSNLAANKITKYRKYQDTLEGDYQFNPRTTRYTLGIVTGAAASNKS